MQKRRVIKNGTTAITRDYGIVQRQDHKPNDHE
jgi:hypothetical protein